MDKRQCGGITQREGKQVNWALQLPRLPTYRCFLHQEETKAGHGGLSGDGGD